MDVPHDPARHDGAGPISAGLVDTLVGAAEDGHCFLPEPELVVAARRRLEVDAVRLREHLAGLAASGGVVREDVPGTGPDGAPVTLRAVYLPTYHRAEISLANGLLRLLHGGGPDRLAAFASVEWTRAFGWLAARTGSTLSADHRDAVRLALTSRLSVLAGGPGHGTDVVLASVVALTLARAARVLLVAPSEDGAARLSGLTGHPAVTIDGLLRSGRPGDADLIVVDGMSAVDLPRCDGLVGAAVGGAHLLLVGDPGEVASGGAGEVLRDLLAAEAVPRHRLTEVPDQAGLSGVVSNALRIGRGLPPVTTGLPDFFLFACQDPGDIAELVVDVVTRRMPDRFSLDPCRDIQVLTAGDDGPAGTAEVDLALRRTGDRHARAVPIRRSLPGYPAVVLPVGAGLDRDLLYTAVRRARKLMVLVGSRRVLADAVRDTGSGTRYTTLTHRLASA